MDQKQKARYGDKSGYGNNFLKLSSFSLLLVLVAFMALSIEVSAAKETDGKESAVKETDGKGPDEKEPDGKESAAKDPETKKKLPSCHLKNALKIVQGPKFWNHEQKPCAKVPYKNKDDFSDCEICLLSLIVECRDLKTPMSPQQISTLTQRCEELKTGGKKLKAKGKNSKNKGK